MWLLELIPSEKAIQAGAKSTILVLAGNEARDLFKNDGFRLSVCEKMLDDGLLARINIDYKETK